MEKLYRLTQAQLKKHLRKILIKKGRTVHSQKGFLYSPGTHPVLLIAHMDTVHKEPVRTICKSGDGNVWMSPQGIGGDDRNGVWMVLETIKEFDCHVLFCEDEEIGGVGASLFCSSGFKPEVNFIVEFDRQGNNDCVFYDCANDDFENFVEAYGFKTAFGTFSDISIIAPHLKVAAVNLSAGYHNAHTQHEYIVWSEMRDIVSRAKKMISNAEGHFFSYIRATKAWNFGKGKGYYSYSGYDYGYDVSDVGDKIYVREVIGAFEDLSGRLYEAGDDMCFFVDDGGKYYVDLEEGVDALVPIDGLFSPALGISPTPIGKREAKIILSLDDYYGLTYGDYDFEDYPEDSVISEENDKIKAV